MLQEAQSTRKPCSPRSVKPFQASIGRAMSMSEGLKHGLRPVETPATVAVHRVSGGRTNHRSPLNLGNETIFVRGEAVSDHSHLHFAILNILVRLK
jgi:hypothetical protein